MDTKKTYTNANEFLGKVVTVVIDRPLHFLHPKHKFEYQLNYGYIPDTLSPDGEELDAYVIGVDHPVVSFTGNCIAVIHRTNDADDKLVVVPEGMNLTEEEIRLATHFQEQFFQSKIVLYTTLKD